MKRFIVCSFLGDFSPDVLNPFRPTSAELSVLAFFFWRGQQV
jgi:hypothetical protein